MRTWQGVWGLMLASMLLAGGCGDDAGGANNAGTDGGGTGGGGAGTGGGGTGGGGAGTGGGGTPAGEPIDAPAMTWSYVHFPKARCRDGEETGLGININPDSDKLIFFFAGGGACFNALTCGMNPESWGEADLGTPGGVLRRGGDNPFADWNMVYVPYCTGDIFSGAAEEGYNGEPQIGYLNVGEYLKRIVPTFPNIKQVVLSGSSAGGFGVAWNAARTQEAFGDIPVHVLNDSGPPLGPMYTTACLQQHLGKTWNWAESIHPSCTECDVDAGHVALPLTLAAREQSSNQRLAILSFSEDSTIKLFLGFGLDDCVNISGGGFPSFPEGDYPKGLAELRELVGDDPNFAMFEVAGSGHTFLGGDLAGVMTGDKNMLDWIIEFRDGASTWGHAVPE